MPRAYNDPMPTAGTWRGQGCPARGLCSRPGWWASCALLWFACAVLPVHAQPAAAGDRQGTRGEVPGATTPRAAVALDLTLTFGPEDPGYFNYTDYDESALRLALVSLGASYRLADWLEAVGEVQTANTSRARVSALYLRLRPWPRQALQMSAGRIPPVFGAFARTRYGGENPLISLPLAYQYLSTLRPDAVPESADALLAVRGRGWYVAYPSAGPPPGAGAPPADYEPGAAAPPPEPVGRPGVALVTASRWDTGVVVHAAGEALAITGGVTMGSLSDPRVDENNAGKQIVGRLEWRPNAALVVGLSGARGAFASRAAVQSASTTANGGWPQQALGVDADFSRGHLRVRGEVIASSWRIRTPRPPVLDDPLRAVAATLEARLRVGPRVDLACRGDWIGFSKIAGTLYEGRRTAWDADVARLEAGLSYRVSRRTRVKLVYQHDWRFATTRRTDGFPAAQLAIRF